MEAPGHLPSLPSPKSGTGAGHRGRRCETERKTKIKIYGHHQKIYGKLRAGERQHS